MTLVMTRALNQFLIYIELVAVIFMFIPKMERRKLWWLRLIGCLGVSLAVCMAVCLLDDYLFSLLNTASFSYGYFLYAYFMSVFMHMIVFVLFEATLLVLIRTTFRSALSIGCAAFSMQNIARCLFIFYRLISNGDTIYPVKSFVQPLNVFVYLIIYAAVYAAGYFLFICKRESGDGDYFNNRVLCILIGLILVNVFIGSVDAPKDSEQAYVLYCFVLALRIVLCIVGLVMQFNMFDWAKLQFRQEQMQQIMLKQKEQYEIAKENIETVNINAHDLRGQIEVLKRAILDSGGNEAIQKELIKMEKNIGVVDTIYHTGNKSLDITLTEKSRFCAAKNITLSTIADGSCIGFMADVDVYMLFGSAFDNAIEATEKIEDEEGRIISFSLRKERGFVYVHLENTASAAPEFVGGIPQTIKKDKNMHGYGVKRIIQIAEKYSGNVKMHAGNGIFYLDILMPLNETD